MTHDSSFRRFSLGSGELINLDDARGTTIRIGRGQVWVTQDGDPVDHVLDAGDTFAVERNGLTLVQAQDASIVDLTGPAAARAVVPLAGVPASGQVATWLGKIANDWIDRRWAPYL